MKKIIFLVILIVLFTGCNPKPIESVENETVYPKAHGIEVYYCEGLSYTYELRTENGRDVGYCVFPGGAECNAFDFIAGDCGSEFTLCSIKGYTPNVFIEETDGVKKSYAVCIFPDNSFCTEADFFNRNCHVKW